MAAVRGGSLWAAGTGRMVAVMSAWAKPGVKVVCVDAKFRRGDAGLVPGATYSIVSVFPQRGDAGGRYRDGLAVILQGIANPFDPDDGAFALARFRPLVTKTQEQDVAKFRHLLTPSPIDAGLVPAGVELVE
jgi:hypothetical protein